MRAIGTEMLTLGLGMPVLYFAVAGVAFNNLTPAGAILVGALSFILIAVGRDLRVRAALPNNASADAARLVRNNASSDAIDHNTYPSNLGSAKRLEPRKTPVDPTRRIA